MTVINENTIARIESEHQPGAPIGDGHYLRETTENGKPVGAIVSHLYQENQDAPVQLHQVAVAYEGSPSAVTGQTHPGNTVKVLRTGDKVTLDPGLRCNCGDVGYVRNGKWVSRGNIGEEIEQVDANRLPEV